MSDLTALENAWCDWMEKRGFRTIEPQEERVSQISFIAGARAESARIRAELWAWLVGDRPEDAGYVCGRKVVPEINRICPEGKE